MSAVAASWRPPASDLSRRMIPAGMCSELDEKGPTDMASSGKKKTTMAKLMRESRLRERRLDKQARKDARKQAQADGQAPGEALGVRTDELAEPQTGEPVLETAAQPSAGA
jgi:hypothetical protein